VELLGSENAVTCTEKWGRGQLATNQEALPQTVSNIADARHEIQPRAGLHKPLKRTLLEIRRAGSELWNRPENRRHQPFFFAVLLVDVKFT
jgi:hypothetical protein